MLTPYQIIMSKLTETDDELRHLCETGKAVSDALMQSFNISVRLLEGDREIRGRLCGRHGANNGGHGGQWQYSETITIQVDSGDRFKIDLLDVRSVTSIQQ